MKLDSLDAAAPQASLRYAQVNDIRGFYRRAGNPPAVLLAGAEAFRRDVLDAEVRFLDTGLFAMETHVNEIGPLIRDFLDRVTRGAKP